jgi:predicted DCC family thiol-disulfide oxidoreductase YuxK
MRPVAEHGWVLYDGDCAFCTRWLRFWAPTFRRRGFEIDTLQADWTSEAFHMACEEITGDIRVLTVSGQTYSGADVYLYMSRRIWWAWPFGILFSLPGLRSLIWVGYRWFAANRYCVSGRCSRES